MKNLIRIIGKAPSELTPEEWLEKLQGERRRVQDALLAFTQGTSTSFKKTTKATREKKKELSLKQQLALIESYGLSVEALKEFAKRRANGES